MIKKIPFFIATVFILSNGILAESYQRIISLSPSTTKSLYALGLDKEIIGITIYCPKGVSKKESIGTLIEPDLEKIVSLKPDLIVASKEGNTKSFIEKLQSLKFRVFTAELAQNFDALCSNFSLLAKEVERQKEAQKEIETAKSYIENLRAKIKNREISTLFWEVGTSPLYTAGKQSFLNDYNLFSRTKNIYEDSLNLRYSPIDMESVVLKNPQIIICMDMDGVEIDKEVEKWKRWKNLSAVQNGKIFAVRADDFFSLTPMGFAKALGILIGLIY